MLGLLVLLSCSSGILQIPDDTLRLEVTSPTYAAFTGSDEVRVTGIVFPNRAVVTVENREVVVGTDGQFDVTVPIVRPYRNIDVRAFYKEQDQRERIPVFSGVDPLEAWPGGIGVRLTPRFFEPIATQIADQIDASNWEDQLLAQIPSIETAGFWMIPNRLWHRPAQVELLTTDTGLVLDVRLRDVFLDIDGGFDVQGTSVETPTRIGWEEFRLTARVNLFVDATGGLRFTTDGADLTLSDPVIELGSFDLNWLGFALDFVGNLITGIGDFLVDGVLGIFGDVPLGGPIEQEIDLLGTPLVVSLADLGTDSEGVFLDLGLGIGGPPPNPLLIHRPSLADGRPAADVIIALYEGLFAPLLQSELLDLVSQDLELNGFLGAGIGLIFRNLPRGGEAPEADGWCVRVTPGDAKVARMGGTVEEFAALYLPDLRLNVGLSHDGIRCDPWLEASLAVTASFGLRGTSLDIGLEAPDGAVFFYGVEGEYDELEVVQGLAGLFDLLLNFAGSSLSIDLADLLGGGAIPGLDGADPRVTGVFPIEENGEVVPGLYAIGLDVL